MFPYVDAETATASEEAFILMAGCPLKDSEEDPDIAIRQNGNTWEIEIAKDQHYLKLRVMDQETVPEFEVLELR
jgi:hypothetical protein